MIEQRAVRLHLPSGEPVDVWRCVDCGAPYPHENAAAGCCRCSCGEKSDQARHSWMCAACLATCDQRRRAEREAKTAALVKEAAPLLPTDEYVFRADLKSDDYGGFGTIRDVTEIAESDASLQGKEVVLWAAKPFGLRGVDVRDLVETMTQDMHEGAADQLADVEGLQKLIDDWIAKQDVVSFEEDYTRCRVVKIGGAR